MVTVTSLEVLYAHAREAAKASSLSLEEALTQFIALSLPEMENNLSSDIRSKIAALPLFSDVELWDIANDVMDDELQTQLETLAELQKHRPLAEAEQTKLANLMDEAQRVMLRKAEVYRLLARHGHTVFHPRIS